jgi:dTDP-4-amino-4,6-dideoxygalactose transaminase
VDHLLATSGERAAVAVIHYFGFPKVSPALRRLCEGHGAILIEDFAQAPFSRDASDRPLSDEAPLSVFSLNKFLPVTEGAAAFSNASEVSLQIFEDSRGTFPPDATSSYNEHLRAVARLVESTSDDPGFLTSAMTSIGDTYESYYRHIHPGVTDWRSSDCVGGNLIPSFDYTSMVSRRRMNAELLYASIAWDNWHLGEPTLTSGVVPFAIPILVPREDRDSIVRSLLGSGVWLAVLQEKWNFIPAGRESEFPIETEWLQSHVLAPVGEWIPADRIQDMGLALNRAAADRASRKVRRDVH